MEPDVSNLLSVAAAIDVIDRLPVTPRKIQLPLEQAAGLRLAEDLTADRDYPPVNKSLMDGYAVRSADCASAGAELTVVGEVAAGQTAAAPIGPGQAMSIMTGSPLPPGADAVIPVENAGGKFIGTNAKIRPSVPAIAGRFIAVQGSDAKQGTTILSAGTLLSSAQLAVAACVGASTVSVYDRPNCTVLATGNEIIPYDQNPSPSQLRNSNGLMLCNLLKRLGCNVRDMGIAPDTSDKIAAAVQDGLAADCLFISGAVSMGRYDYVPAVLKDLGGELKITKLRIKPGKPFIVAAMPGGKYVFGLPGNPVSALVCTIRLAARLLSRFAGGPPGPPHHAMSVATLSQPLAENGPREFYQPAVLEGGHVRPLPWKGSADTFTLAAACALIVRPENAPAVAAGGSVPIIELP